MTDRDTFAAAALTGLLARGLLQSNLLAADAYKVADAMLRERGNHSETPNSSPNLDAAPAAIVPEPEPSAARRRPAGGTGDTDHGASPEARASVGRPRTDNADLPTCAGTGDTPEIAAYRRFVGEVMNWISEATGFMHDDVLRTDYARDIITDACSRCWDAFDRIAYPTVHDAAPAAIASVDSVAPQPTTRGESDRNDKAAPRPSEGTGDTPDSPQPIACSVFDRSQPIAKPTPVHTPPAHATPSVGSERREGTEPVAWGVASHFRVLATSISRTDAVDMQGDYAYHTEIVPLYRSPTLTREEMKAIQRAADKLATQTPTWQPDVVSVDHEGVGLASVLRGLLKRLGGGR